MLKSALFIEKNKKKNMILAFSARDIGNIKKGFAEKDGLRNGYWCII
ncbi:hypothetical protein HMPREF0204_12713 [Chryseobacterium gleum ATCC 35910]|uniref:Uncharacterized protein n=1 Tax=Chryseobacterium gleum ATCC 35910 TaxID=525257 RepID=A0ABP2ILE0_CHRGE|nr:hypothetical protein HMPREF0204_12713 [Chryseobacterium gleum ATCC 35910]